MKKYKGLFLDILYMAVILFVIRSFAVNELAVYTNQELLAAAVLFIAAGLLIALGSVFGKVIISLAGYMLFDYLYDGALCNYEIMIIIVSLLFIIFAIKKEWRFRMCPQHRLVCLLCFFMAYTCSHNYQRIINDEADRHSYNLDESDYYYYHHPENEEEFLNRFGKLAYLDKTITDGFWELIDRKTYMEEIESYVADPYILSQNDYSGIFRDKNILIIQADYLYECFVSEELTPNIANIRDTSIHVTGFDNPFMSYSVNDAEYMLNLSLFASGEDGCFSYIYDDKPYGETLASMFDEAGYRTIMQVNDFEVFFNHERLRNIYGYKEMRSPYYYGLDGIQKNYTMLKELPYAFSESEKTLIYYSPNEITDIGEELTSQLKELYPKALKDDIVMIANIIELDQALGEFYKELQFYKLVNDTVVILCGYNDNITQSVTAFGKEVNKPSETLLYIYDGGNTTAEYPKKASSLDLIPTLANLFDLNCDTSHIIGRDIFDDNYHGMQITNVRELTSYWYADNFWYQYTTHKYEIENDYDRKTVLDEIQEIKQRVRFSYYWTKYGDKYLAEHQS